ncbi:poly(A) polymerase pla1 [Nosema bombycis CQ1]|uniref:Poly(A) polymerase n=1 Tax=Nosema bombycis (strain CQ1 / CVCC 102059) TaxID=578461 RepID=R0MRL0_NOSB1|nr:poly(A) polymerase pla1 [Nosema bombycis CQ1]|eukprot:EOB15538.1 poly(A) polymerase pla1 [Nosema bombycis CQ1]
MDSLEKNIKHGVTGPISTKEATDEDQKKDKEMDMYLRACGFFEDESMGQTRERVLGRLNHLLKEFVFAMAEKRKIVSDGKNIYGGKIFTFGSYRLGVHSKGADIDVLCIVPKHVTRKDFFVNFYFMLEKEKDIKDLTKIEEAYVPLIKLKIQDIPIDLTFARLNVSSVKDNINLLNNSILKNMDEKCVLSLNGSRVTDEILNLVPNINTFHSALRCIKYWAKRRCIYGNSYGYFGGVAFSISVARVCQMFPNASSYFIVGKYFETYASWKWPSPVILKPIIDLSYNMKVWDPKVYPSDKYHKMPVITPAYPSICSTHNVTNSTQNLIQKEFQRANEILNLKDDDLNCISTPVTSILKDLFTLSDFFRDHKFFLQVLVLSTEEDLFGAWEGFVESKIRILATKMENIEDVSFAYPFPQPFRMEGSKINPKFVCCTAFFVGFELTSSKVTKKIYVNQPVEEFVGFINDYERKTSSMSIEIKILKRREVHNFLSVYYSNEK